MITISDGILTIPEGERFVGFTGDNRHTQKKFFIRQTPESGWLYRLYLTFDDGRQNFFLLPATLTQEGTILEWSVQEDHILKSGLVRAQIKAFSEDNEVYHTTSDVFIAGKTAEEDEYFKNSNSEFLAYEKTLNDLYRKMKNASAKMPYVGENGNWFYYDEKTEVYKDSGVSSSVGVKDKSVTPQKLDRTYWESRTSVETQITRADDLFAATGFIGDGGSIAFLNVNTTVNIGENDVELANINGFCYAVGVKFVNGDTVYLINVTDGTQWKINRYNEGSELVPVYKLQCFRHGVSDGTITPEKLDRKYLERCVTEYGETISTFAELFDKVGRINRGGKLGFVKLYVSDNDNDTVLNYGYLSGDFMALGTPTNSDICLINLRSGENWTVSDNGDGKYIAYKVDVLTPRVEYLERELAKQNEGKIELPEYWKSYIAQKISAINALQTQGGKDAFSFVVIADMHYEQNLSKLAPFIANKIAEECGIKYILILGDSGTRNGILYDLDYINTEWENIEKMIAPIRNKLLITDGNHDGSYGATDADGDGVIDDVHGLGNSAFNFTPEKKYSIIKRKVSLLPDVVFDESGCGYYADDKAAKVRYIVLSTHNNKYEENEDGSSKYSNMNNFRFGQSQFDLVIKALDTLEEGWSVLVASHVPLDRSGELIHWGAAEMQDNRLVSGEVECWVMADLLNAFVNRRTFTGSFTGTQGATATYKNLADKTSSDWLKNTRTSSGGTSAESGFDVTNFLGDGVTPVGDMTIYYKNATMSNQRLVFYNANKEVIYNAYPTTFTDKEGFDGSATEGRLFIDKEKNGVLSTTAVYVRLCLVSGDSSPIITLNEPIGENGEVYDAVSVDADFTGANGTLIGYFGGHVHKDGAWDKTYTWDNRLKQCDFWTITTRCDSKNENSSDLLNQRIRGTINEQSFDVFTVNTKEKKIYATKIGAGEDRVLSY